MPRTALSRFLSTSVRFLRGSSQTRNYSPTTSCLYPTARAKKPCTARVKPLRRLPLLSFIVFRSDHRFRLSVGAHETAVVQLRRVRVTVLSKSEGREGPGQPGGGVARVVIKRSARSRSDRRPRLCRSSLREGAEPEPHDAALALGGGQLLLARQSTRPGYGGVPATAGTQPRG